MQLIRMFSTDSFKGTRNYLNTQKKFEIIRTVIYFGISLSLFAAGWITTGSKMNLLTIVAVLGCLPACKSAVQMIMFLRYKSLSAQAAEEISSHCNGLSQLYDMIFTSYEKNFSIGHMTVKGNTIIGYTEDPKLEEKAFYRHIDQVLKTDRHMHTSVKIFTDIRKYAERLEQLKELDTEEANTEDIIRTLKSVVL